MRGGNPKAVRFTRLVRHAGHAMVLVGIVAPGIAMAAGSETVSAKDKTHQAINLGDVTANAKATKTGGVLTPKRIFQSDETRQVVTKHQIKAVGPTGGSAQALSLAPGVTVRGYGGSSGTARYEVTMRGMKVGWSSVNGDVERNGITVLFDGVPMNDLIAHNGQWDSNEIPILSMIDGINFIYGPGNPASRWFDSLGGTINFVPLQPSKHAKADLGTFWGSYGTHGVNLSLDSGEHDGWSAVLAGGYTKNNTFRSGSFKAPSRSYAYYGNIRKAFSTGVWSVGGYWDNTEEWRPNFIPLKPIPGVTTEGLNANAPLYSQPTSGYYASLPYAAWHKQLTVRDWMLYTKLSLALERNLRLHALMWYRHGHRIHARVNQYLPLPGNFPNAEYYFPTSNTFGNKLWLSWHLPYNTVKFGGYWIQQKYRTPYVGYDVGYDPTTGTTYGPWIDYNAPSIQYNSDYLYNTYLSAFLQDRIEPLHGFSVTPGLAAVEYQTQFYNSGNADFPQAAANTTAQNVTSAQDSSRTFYRVEPSLGLRLQATHWSSYYANYSVSYQNPTDNTFGAYNSTTNLGVLKPIRSTDYEAGAKFMFHDLGWLRALDFNLALYQDKLNNETVATYLTNITLSKFASASAVYQGVDLAFTAQTHSELGAFGNLAFQHAHYTRYVVPVNGSNQSFSGYPVSYNPKVTATLGVDGKFYQSGFILEPRLWDQYTGTQYLFSNVTGAPTRQTMPAFNVLNVALDVTTVAFNHYVPYLHGVKLTLGVNNVLDTRYNPIEYITSGGYFGGNSAGAILADPGAPSEWYVSANYSF
ncbi:TonB-dependent receptor [Acidihalobacter aeolianus]|nr:TonB-dependent receptor [Acidihalobacter aeolianus]